jgi:Ca2+-transporting ATPase
VNAGEPVPEQGLPAVEAARRLREEGPNALPAGRRRTAWAIALEAMREPMFLLLFLAGALYLVFGELREGLTLFGFVAVTVAMTLYQEGKTERALEALRDLTSPRARVIRGGTERRIAGREVVRGDVLLVGEGERVAADGLLVSANALQVDESLLTGEAVPVRKRAAEGQESPARPGGDDTPFVFAGTMVVAGQGMARVSATGAKSEIGRIGAALETLAPEDSPLKRQTAKLIRTLALIGLAASVLLILVQGSLRGDWLAAVLAGIALAMALLPEEYPVVLTVFPALGAWRLSRRQVLTRRVSAIETLGAVSVLCVDKTGTLTENRMTVAQLHAGGSFHEVDGADGALPERFHALVEFAVLASESSPFDPMEQAFHRLGERVLPEAGPQRAGWSLVHEYGLTSQLRAMAHAWQRAGEDGFIVAAKGAPEAVLDLCRIPGAERETVLAAADVMAAQGLRVLAAARARFAGGAWPQDMRGFNFEFLGLLGLIDPLRAGVAEAVLECQDAGIRVLMITGDYPATARAIAMRAGLAPGDIVNGEEIGALSEDALRARLRGAQACARISPEQKLRIVRALQADGAVVAMTGDGVNDAPALKAAHVGIAMGARGTDVAREAAALTLLDDNFASIVRAVRLGRRIFDNMQKSMSYILAVHVPIAGAALVPALFGWPPLMLPMHIAFLELVIDPACTLAFEGEPPDDEIMRRAPRAPDAPLFAGATIASSLVQGAMVLAAVIGLYAWGHRHLEENDARALAFVAMATGNLTLLLVHRSRSRLIIETLARANATLWVIEAVSLALLAAVLYVPGLNDVFRMSALAPALLALGAGAGVLAALPFEAVKLAEWWFARRVDAAARRA